MKKIIKNSFIVSLVGVFFIGVGCQEPKYGCLDANAVNFDVAADDACTDNCCTYPSLVVQADYFVGNEKFNLNKKYKIENDSLEFLSAQLYLSDFILTTPDNKMAQTVDSVLLYRATDSVKVQKNVVLVGKNLGFDFTVGQFNKPITYSKISFTVGLNSETNKGVPSRQPSDSPLSTKADSMYLTNGKTYIFNKLVFIRKSKNDTVRIHITTEKSINIVKNLSFRQGFNAAIPLKINYLQFFKGIDLTQPQNVIQEKIVNNTEGVFSIQ